MPASSNIAESLLAIDVGGIHTRAYLFDIVEGRYRFLGSGVASSTFEAPYKDLREGIRFALDQLKEITGRQIIDEDERLIIPSRHDGSGIDVVVATTSAGPPLKVILIGQLEDVSLSSAASLARTTYAQISERLWLTDQRRIDERISSIIRAMPDLVIVAGGTNGGASQSVMKMLNAVGLASFLQVEQKKPEILFVGNSSLHAEVKNTLASIDRVTIAPNVRPSIDEEQLDPAQLKLAAIYRRIRSKQMTGFAELDNWAKGNLMPTSMAVGRLVRALSKIYGGEKGVLGVDVSADAITLAAGFLGELVLGVYPEFSPGYALSEIQNYCKVTDIQQWLRLDIPVHIIQNYLHTKATFPASIPATLEDMDIEQAIVRTLLGLSMKKFKPQLHKQPGFYEPIIFSGSFFSRLSNYSHALHILLDGIQPVGITTVVLDQNHLMPPLGAALSINPLLSIQSIDSGAFLNLGSVISPVGTARPGTPVMSVRIEYESGSEAKAIVKYGRIEVLPLSQGQRATLHLQPYHRFDIGMGGAGRGGKVKVVGGLLGVMVDARGRPLKLQSDPARRREQAIRWMKMIGQ